MTYLLSYPRVTSCNLAGRQAYNLIFPGAKLMPVIPKKNRGFLAIYIGTRVRFLYGYYVMLKTYITLALNALPLVKQPIVSKIQFQLLFLSNILTNSWEIQQGFSWTSYWQHTYINPLNGVSGRCHGQNNFWSRHYKAKLSHRVKIPLLFGNQRTQVT